MRKNILEKVIDVATVTIILAAIHLRNGGGIEVTVQVLCYLLMASIIGITVVDTVHRVFEEPKLATWRLWVGSGSVLAGAWMHGRFFFSESWRGYIYLAISLAFYGFGVWWLCFPYHLSVLGKPELERYNRKRFSGRIERVVERVRKALDVQDDVAVKKGTVSLRRLLARVLLFYCPDCDYKANPSYAVPFDSAQGLGYYELMHSKSDGAKDKATKSWQHICAVGDRLIQTGYNNEDIQAMDSAAQAKKDDKEAKE